MRSWLIDLGKSVFIIAVVLSLLAIVPIKCHGQCPGGSCPTQRPQVSAAETPHKAIVKIESVDPQTEKTTGGCTGAIVGVNEGIAYVLTAAHAVGEDGKPRVVLADGRSYWADAIPIDPLSGVAVLAIRDPDVGCIAVADTEPRPGETLYGAGWGIHGTDRSMRPDQPIPLNIVYRSIQGPFLSVKASALEVGWASRQGDSGGPIWNARGQLVGVIARTDGRVTLGPCLPRVRAALRFFLPPYPKRVVAAPIPPAPKQPGVSPSAPGCCPPGQTCPPTKPIWDVQPPVVDKPVVPIAPEAPSAIDELKAEIAALRAKVDSMTLVQGPPGPTGPKGDTGPASIAPTAAELTAKLPPPISIGSLAPDGTVWQEAVPVKYGDKVYIRAFPPPKVGSGAASVAKLSP